jgi:lipopolysaccharide export system protein LptC
LFTLKNTIMGFLIILAIGLSSWSIFLSKKVNITSSNSSSQPDAFMENVIATIINKEGLRSLLIESPRMVHYSENDTTFIESPHITVYRDSPQPWHINSDYAKATKGIDKLFFWSNVIIHHPHDSSTPITTFKTTTLTVFPHEKIAQTSDEVTLSQPETVVHAIGMTANFNNGEVKLLSQARGEYAPSH